jgi:hypothetical protein
MRVTKPPAGQFLRTACRLTGLLAYAGSLLIYRHAVPVAAKAYDDLCASQGATFYAGPSIGELGAAMTVVGLPLLLARGTPTIVANLIVGLGVLLETKDLLVTAGWTPYECFTQAGTYEDHTSGLDEFVLGLSLVVVLSYVMLAVDLAIWLARLVMRRRAERAVPQALNPPRS